MLKVDHSSAHGHGGGSRKPACNLHASTFDQHFYGDLGDYVHTPDETLLKLAGLENK